MKLDDLNLIEGTRYSLLNQSQIEEKKLIKTYMLSPTPQTIGSIEITVLIHNAIKKNLMQREY